VDPVLEGAPVAELLMVEAPAAQRAAVDQPELDPVLEVALGAAPAPDPQAEGPSPGPGPALDEAAPGEAAAAAAIAPPRPEEVDPPPTPAPALPQELAGDGGGLGAPDAADPEPPLPDGATDRLDGAPVPPVPDGEPFAAPPTPATEPQAAPPRTDPEQLADDVPDDLPDEHGADQPTVLMRPGEHPTEEVVFVWETPSMALAVGAAVSATVVEEPSVLLPATPSVAPRPLVATAAPAPVVIADPLAAPAGVRRPRGWRLDREQVELDGPGPLVVWGQLLVPCVRCGAPVAAALRSGVVGCGRCGAQTATPEAAWARLVGGPALLDCIAQRAEVPGRLTKGPWLRLSRGEARCPCCAAPWSTALVDALIGGLSSSCSFCGGEVHLEPPPDALAAAVPGLRLCARTDKGGIVLLVELPALHRWRALLARPSRRSALVTLHRRLPLGLLRRLSAAVPARERAELAARARLPGLQRALATDPQPGVRAHLARAPRLDRVAVELLLRGADPAVLNQLAGRPDLGRRQLLVLAQQVAVLGEVPTDPEGPPLLHPTLGAQPAERLAASPVVRRMPLRALDALLGAGEGAVEALAHNPALPEGALLRWAALQRPAALTVRAGHAGRLPLTAQRALAAAEDWELRALVALHPGLHPEVLRALARDPAVEVRAAVARNPSTPLGTLHRLDRDRSEAVSADARANPSWSPPSPWEWVALMFGLHC
jgi:hypothetical protein